MKETARDVMQTQVVALSPDDPLHVAQRLFYEEGIHGAPVVDNSGMVVGMLTTTDILRAITETKEVAPAEPGIYRDDLDSMLGAWNLAPEDFKERVQDVVVGDYMTEELVHVSPELPVRELARTLRENQIHRVLVLENGSLCGIVSTFDLVGLLEREG
jgi:CBS domain-containing protein